MADDFDTWYETHKQEPEISITGLEAVRSDVADITQEAQETVLTWLLTDDLADAKSQTFDYLQELHEDIGNGDMPIEKVAKRSGISKSLSEYGSDSRRPSPLVRGRKYATSHFDGEEGGQGSKPLKIEVSAVPSDYPQTFSAATAEDGDIVDTISVEDTSNIPNGFEVDWESHRKKVLVDPFEPILQAMHWSWDEIVAGVEQYGFEDFY